MEERREEAFTLGFEIQKEGVKSQITDIVEGALIEIVEQDRVDIIFVCSVYKLAKSVRVMEALTQQAVSRASIYMQIALIVKKLLDRFVEEIRFEDALEEQLTKYGMVQVSLLCSSSMSPHSSLAFPHQRNGRYRAIWMAK